MEGDGSVSVGRFGFQVRVELYVWAQFPLYTHKTQINAPVVHPPEEGLALEQQPRQHAADAPQIHGVAVVRVAQQELGGLFFWAGVVERLFRLLGGRRGNGWCWATTRLRFVHPSSIYTHYIHTNIYVP